MPIEIDRNGNNLGKLGPGSGSLEVEEVRVWYGGDVYRSYAVQFNHEPVDSGTVGEVPVVISLGRRVLPTLEAGRVDTVSDNLRIRFQK